MNVEGYDLPESAVRLARDLATAPAVVGVVLGGSRARGRGCPGADVDFGLYYDSATFDWKAVVTCIEKYDDERSPRGLAPPGAWGPWMNGGAWLLVEGLAVDVLLRDIKFVEHIGKEVSAGRFSSNYQIGHPHGWHSYMVLSEVHYNRPVAGDLARLDALHKCTVPYPIRLRSAIVDRFLFEAKFTLSLLRKLEGRDESTHCAGLSYRCVMSLVQVLFALNETWVVNEKGAVDETSRFRDAPTDFAARAHAVSEPSAVSRLARNAALASLFEDVGELARRLGFDPTWDDASFPRD